MKNFLLNCMINCISILLLYGACTQVNGRSIESASPEPELKQKAHSSDPKKIFIAKVKLMNNSMVKGTLLEANDSMIILANSCEKINVLQGLYEPIEISFKEIKFIKIRSTDKVGNKIISAAVKYGTTVLCLFYIGEGCTTDLNIKFLPIIISGVAGASMVGALVGFLSGISSESYVINGEFEKYLLNLFEIKTKAYHTNSAKYHQPHK